MPGSDAIVDLLRLRGRLEEAVREAGALALQKFGSPLKNWLKNNVSPVTEADIAVDLLLRERLSAILPDAGWLSEESEDNPARLDARRVWIVDPIDGTRAFLAGRTDWAVAAALIDDGRPVLGALFAPAEDTMFLAANGLGTTVNNVQVQSRPGGDMTGALVAGPKRHIDALTAAGERIEPVPRVHSLALRLARVASATLDVAFAGGNSRDWDIAAADVIIAEAGGALTAFDGRAVTYNRPDPVHGSLVAAGRDRHEALVRLMQREPAAFA